MVERIKSGLLVLSKIGRFVASRLSFLHPAEKLRMLGGICVAIGDQEFDAKREISVMHTSYEEAGGLAKACLQARNMAVVDSSRLNAHVIDASMNQRVTTLCSALRTCRVSVDHEK